MYRVPDGVRRIAPGKAALPLLLLLVLVGCDSVEERVAEHYESGQELLEEGVPEKAMLEFRNALQLDEDHAPSHYAIGRIHEERGELQPAFKRFRRVVEINPQHADARLKLARMLLMSGAPDQANTHMTEVLKLDPNRADVQALKATLDMEGGDFDAAREALDLALTLDPENVEAALAEAVYLLQTATPAAALARVDQALAGNPANLPLHLVKLQLLQRMDDRAGIGAQLTAMVEAFPEELRFREARAHWAVETDDLGTAEADLRALVEAKPGESEPVKDLIRLLRRKDGDEAARAELAALAERQGSLDLQLLLAQFDVETGRKAEAIAYLRDLIDRAGEGVNKVRVALAQLLVSEGEKEETNALVDTVLAEDPSNVDALVLRIARLIDEERLEQAIQEVRRGLNEAPDDVRLLRLGGRAHELSGTLDIASDRYAKAVRVEGYRPGTVEQYVQFLLRADRASAAETVLAEAVARNPEEARLHDLLGFLRVRLGNWAGAEQAARNLEKLDPERARQLRAAILIGQEQFDEGVDLLRDLPSDERRRAASIAAIVQTYVREGRTQEAESFLDELLTANPEHLQALGIRGNLHLAAGDLDAAEEKYRAVLAIDPTHGGAHSALARLFAQRGDAAAEEEQLLAGLEASPDNPTLLTRLAVLREMQGRFDEAIEIYEDLYRLVPDSLVIANNLASLLSDHRAGNPEELDRAYEIAGRLRPSNVPQYRDTYGWTRYLKGEHEEALAYIAPAADTMPDNPWVLYHLGMVHAARGEPAKARTALEAALEEGADLEFPPADEIRRTLEKLEGQ